MEFYDIIERASCDTIQAKKVFDDALSRYVHLETPVNDQQFKAICAEQFLLSCEDRKDFISNTKVFFDTKAKLDGKIAKIWDENNPSDFSSVLVACNDFLQLSADIVTQKERYRTDLKGLIDKAQQHLDAINGNNANALHVALLKKIEDWNTLLKLEILGGKILLEVFNPDSKEEIDKKIKTLFSVTQIISDTHEIVKGKYALAKQNAVVRRELDDRKTTVFAKLAKDLGKFDNAENRISNLLQDVFNLIESLKLFLSGESVISAEILKIHENLHNELLKLDALLGKDSAVFFMNTLESMGDNFSDDMTEDDKAKYLSLQAQSSLYLKACKICAESEKQVNAWLDVVSKLDSNNKFALEVLKKYGLPLLGDVKPEIFATIIMPDLHSSKEFAKELGKVLDFSSLNEDQQLEFGREFKQAVLHAKLPSMFQEMLKGINLKHKSALRRNTIDYIKKKTQNGEIGEAPVDDKNAESAAHFIKNIVKSSDIAQIFGVKPSSDEDLKSKIIAFSKRFNAIEEAKKALTELKNPQNLSYAEGVGRLQICIENLQHSKGNASDQKTIDNNGEIDEFIEQIRGLQSKIIGAFVSANTNVVVKDDLPLDAVKKLELLQSYKKILPAVFPPIDAHIGEPQYAADLLAIGKKVIEAALVQLSRDKRLLENGDATADLQIAKGLARKVQSVQEANLFSEDATKDYVDLKDQVKKLEGLGNSALLSNFKKIVQNIFPDIAKSQAGSVQQENDLAYLFEDQDEKLQRLWGDLQQNITMYTKINEAVAERELAVKKCIESSVASVRFINLYLDSENIGKTAETLRDHALKLFNATEDKISVGKESKILSSWYEKLTNYFVQYLVCSEDKEKFLTRAAQVFELSNTAKTDGDEFSASAVFAVFNHPHITSLLNTGFSQTKVQSSSDVKKRKEEFLDKLGSDGENRFDDMRTWVRSILPINDINLLRPAHKLSDANVVHGDPKVAQENVPAESSSHKSSLINTIDSTFVAIKKEQALPAELSLVSGVATVVAQNPVDDPIVRELKKQAGQYEQALGERLTRLTTQINSDEERAKKLELITNPAIRGVIQRAVKENKALFKSNAQTAIKAFNSNMHKIPDTEHVIVELEKILELGSLNGKDEKTAFGQEVKQAALHSSLPVIFRSFLNGSGQEIVLKRQGFAQKFKTTQDAISESYKGGRFISIDATNKSAAAAFLMDIVDEVGDR